MLIVGFGKGQVIKEVAKIFVGLKSICLGGLDKTVQTGAGLGTFWAAG